MTTLLSLRKKLSKIKQIIGIDLKQDELLLTAFIHRSFINENRSDAKEHNERLEFLGDSVLGMIVASMLYKAFPEEPEGVLSQFRSRLVDVDACAFYMEKIGLNQFILLGKGEEKTQGHQKSSILANVFEAVIAAIFLEGGYSLAEEFLTKQFFEEMHKMLQTPSSNYKAILQDYSQKKSQKTPSYKVVKEEGPDHAKRFYVKVFVEEEEIGEGEGFSKKDAEQKAARKALEFLKEQGKI